MRNLCLALILANLAFAVWQYGRPDADARPHRAGDGARGIRLVSEVPAEAAARAVRARVTPEAGAEAPAEPSPEEAPGGAPAGGAASGVEPGPEAGPPAREAETAAESGGGDTAASRAAAASGEPGTVCRSVGPFEELSQAAAAAAALRAEGFGPTQRVAEGEIWVGYWVYIDAIATTERADSMLAELHAGGLTEAYVIADTSADDNIISLGVFTELAGAERLREQVRALGFEPTVTDRTRRGNVYWVDAELGPDAELDLDSLQPAGRIVRLEQRPCP